MFFFRYVLGMFIKYFTTKCIKCPFQIENHIDCEKFRKYFKNKRLFLKQKKNPLVDWDIRDICF